jgi:hypothetical protein
MDAQPHQKPPILVHSRQGTSGAGEATLTRAPYQFRHDLYGTCTCLAGSTGCTGCVIARSRVRKRAGRRSNLPRIPAIRRYAWGQVLKPDPPEDNDRCVGFAGIRGRLLRQANPKTSPIPRNDAPRISRYARTRLAPVVLAPAHVSAVKTVGQAPWEPAPILPPCRASVPDGTAPPFTWRKVRRNSGETEPGPGLPNRQGPATGRKNALYGPSWPFSTPGGICNVVWHSFLNSPTTPPNY